MNIICPQCGFGRAVNEATLPPKAAVATCPKCQHRFKFRELKKDPTPQQDTQPQAPTQPEVNASAAEPDMSPETAPPTESTAAAQPATVTGEPSVETQKRVPPSQDEDLWNELEALNDPDGTDRSENVHGHATTSIPVWERVDAGYPRAFAQTFMDVLLNPKAFFTAMPVGHGLLKPLFFFLIIIQAVALSQSIWQLLGIVEPDMLTENLNNTLQAGLVLILYPLEVCVFLFLDTAINHFFLHLFKADTKGFEGTFRAEAYSAAPMLLMIIPYIGLPLAMIGTAVYKFLGLRHVHGATNKQVLAAMILPMILALAVAIILTLVSGWI
jgi:predicted Zn finger-like uncharacterized protein